MKELDETKMKSFCDSFHDTMTPVSITADYHSDAALSQFLPPLGIMEVASHAIATHLAVYYVLCALLALHSESKLRHTIDPLRLALKWFLLAYAVSLSATAMAYCYVIHTPTAVVQLCCLLGSIYLPFVMVLPTLPLASSEVATGVSIRPESRDPESSFSSSELRPDAYCDESPTTTTKPSITVDENQHIENQLESPTDNADSDYDDNDDVEYLDSDDGALLQPVERLHSLSQACRHLLPGLLSPQASSSDLSLRVAGACHHHDLRAKPLDGIAVSASPRSASPKKLPRRASSILGINVDNIVTKKQNMALEIMSVEADAVVQRMLGWIVRKQGFDFLPVQSGEEALQLLEDRSRAGDEHGLPTLILMAVELPGIDGYATTKEIRKLYPNAPIPVITLSGDETEESVQATFGCGANDLVVKPVSKQNLMTRIGAQLKTLHFWRGQLELTRSEHLLKEMLPESIIDRLKEGERLISDQHEEVTIIFTDIVSFTNLSATHSTQDVIQMLDTLFSEFDNLTDKYGIYKVETIGDAYMAVAGLDSASRADQAHRAVSLAADMVAAASKIKMPNGDAIEIRAGIHTGTVHAGVVGRKMPRYCLFGDTVNTASRMESTSYRSCVHLSSAACAAYEKEEPTDNQIKVTRRGSECIKGKGAMETWLAKTGLWKECLKNDLSTILS